MKKKRLLYLGSHSFLDNLNFYVSEILRNAHANAWAFCIIGHRGSRDPNGPISSWLTFLLYIAECAENPLKSKQ